MWEYLLDSLKAIIVSFALVLLGGRLKDHIIKVFKDNEKRRKIR